MNKTALPNPILDSFNNSISLNIDSKNCRPLRLTTKSYIKHKETWKALQYYSDDVLNTTVLNEFNTSNFLIALFDKDACLIKLYGNNSSIKWAKSNYIFENSMWQEKIIGTNAIALGLKLGKSISLIGEEHFAKFAMNIAMYFSPIIFKKNPDEGKENSQYGGIAIIVPKETANNSFLITADSIARVISLHFFWFESVNLFLNSHQGYLVINQSKNNNIIMFISNEIFNIFETPFKDMTYRNLEELIDAYPKNKDFWNIINSKLKVQDVYMKLSIKGIEIKTCLSARPFYGGNFHIEGISLIFNSSDKPQNKLSRIVDNNTDFTFSKILGKDENYLNVIKQAKASALSSVSILLLGESGVGKDIFAQAIHNESARRDKPFVALNCAAFPKELIASELFGYEEGAFTGSKKGGYIGKFELANEGTLFLDEIGDMPLDLQAILLRVIEHKSFMKIGSNKSTNINVRIIAATNRNLLEKVKKGEFREDLYYRIGIIKLVIPPLRNRKNDIILLANEFIERICNRTNRPKVNISPQVIEFFMSYKWPGNVRELQNLLEGVIQIFDSPTISYNHISNYILDSSIDTVIKENTNIKSSIPYSKDHILNALNLNKNNKTSTARYLGISRRTLYNRLNDYNLL